MAISHKCHYALRAVFELAKRDGQGPVKIAEIAKAQSIPPRFLEVILNQLKQAGFVKSQRGVDGGYILDKAPEKINIGEIIEFIDGSTSPVSAKGDAKNDGESELNSERVFERIWNEVEKSIGEIYGGATFRNLIELEKQMAKNYVPAYSI